MVNASNDDKDWAWLNAVRESTVRVDNRRPWAKAYGRQATLRNLRHPDAGKDMRVDVALQGPKSREILLALGCDPQTRQRIMGLKRTQLCDAQVGGFDLVVSRTGYTGEKMAFELFVHPDQAAALFENLLAVGQMAGLKPVGLGARDSLRTEAGLPLYGQEMGDGSGKQGEPDLGVAEGGFGSYVKAYKPWFIGREAYLAREAARKGEVVRFAFPEKGMRMAHAGDPVLDKRGKVIGWVTSCAIDSAGTLTGQAYLDLKNAEQGTPIYIYQSASDKTGKAPADLAWGAENHPTGAGCDREQVSEIEHSVVSCQQSAISNFQSVGESSSMKDFNRLKVWEASHQLTLEIYKATGEFPKEEQYGLTSQLRRACASIPTNIAEGCGRDGNAEFSRFLQIAMGSSSETEYLLLLANELGYINQDQHRRLQEEITSVKRMLTSLIQKVNADRKRYAVKDSA